MNVLESRIRELEKWIRDSARKLSDMLGRLKRLEDRMASIGGGPGGGGGSTGGVFYADGLSIAGGGTGSAELFQTWDDDSIGTQDIINKLPDATTSTKRQLLIRNPDATYTIIAESCTDF